MPVVGRHVAGRVIAERPHRLRPARDVGDAVVAGGIAVGVDRLGPA
jgi:hypothetical protein